MLPGPAATAASVRTLTATSHTFLAVAATTSSASTSVALIGQVGTRQCRQRCRGEVVDKRLHVGRCAGGDDHLAQLGDAVGVSRVAETRPQHLGLGRGRSGGGLGHQHRALAFAQVVTGWFAGEFGVAEHAEQVVAQLEGPPSGRP